MRMNQLAVRARAQACESIDRFRNNCMPTQAIANQLGAEWTALLTVLDATQIARIKGLEKDNARMRRLLEEFGGVA